MTEEMSVRALVVDDEAPARRLIREFLKEYSWVEVVGEAASGSEAIRLAEELEPDLLFLDIQMPKLTGLEVLELLPGSPRIVFVTAFDEYAVRAFEENALDYLLKPVSKERFARTMARVEAEVSRESAGGAAAVLPRELSQKARPPGTYRTRLVVRDGAEVVVIMLSEVDYLQAQDDYVEIHYSGQSQLLRRALRDLEGELDPSEFVRVHRSYVAKVSRIARIEPWSQNSKRLILTGGQQIPLSRAGEARLRSRLT